MMEKTGQADRYTTTSRRLPVYSIALIIGSLFLVTIFAIAVLYPRYTAIKQARTERAGLAARLETQKKLYPVYVRAHTMAQKRFEPELVYPRQGSLPVRAVPQLSDRFDQLAKACGLVFLENHINIGSVDRADMLTLDLKFRGEFSGFRKCLVGLAAQPFFRCIEKFAITVDADNFRQYEVTLKIAINNTAQDSAKDSPS